jgi:hypothetical protein
MTTRFNLKTIAACALLTMASAGFSQSSSPHGDHGHHNKHGTAQATTPAETVHSHGQPSPYAGHESRAIKSLSATQTQDLLAGKGMELAKAAELNGYPGPMHVLELANGLQLTVQQRAATQALLEQHKREARTLGAALIETERQLDAAFAGRSINAEKLAGLTQAIGAAQAALRQSHLSTHLLQTGLLTAQQVKQYQILRGYAVASK